MRHSRVLALVLSVAMFGISASNAEAQFYRVLLQGLARSAVPTSPSATRNGQFRISQEPYMNGWRFDWNRSFGPDALGRPNAIDLGLFDITLNAGQVRMNGQYSNRIIPQITFEAFTPLAIDYSVKLNTGFQDFEINNAQFAYSSEWTLNSLGFYDYQLSASHRGEYETDGFLLVDEGTLNFDIGPINMSGNIFADALTFATQPFFEAIGENNPFAIFSGRATKEIQVTRTINDLTDRATAGEVLTEEELDELIEATLIAAILGDTIPDFSFLAMEEFMPTLDSVNAEILGDDLILTDTPGLVAQELILIPEPATSMLMLVTAVLLVTVRRRT